VDPIFIATDTHHRLLLIEVVYPAATKRHGLLPRGMVVPVAVVAAELHDLLRTEDMLVPKKLHYEQQ
jgi:hypothetical protein